MLKPLIILVCCLTINQTLNSQSFYNSFLNDNYSASFGSYNQPASIVDNRYRWSIGFGVDYNISNNYIGNNINNVLYGSPQLSAYRKPLGKGYYHEALDATLLSGTFQITDKDAIAYSWRRKTYINFDGLEDEITKLDFTKLTDASLIGKTFNQGTVSYQKMEWVEHTFNYARTIINDKKRVIKAGIGLKILNGINAEYLHTEGGDVTFNANEQLSFNQMEFSYGKSDDNNQLTNSNLGLGLDIGAVYEYRPEYKYLYYDMDNVRKNPSKHLNKYLYKIGASIINIGGIKYTKDSSTYDFVNANNATVNYRDVYDSQLDANNINRNILPFMQKDASNKETFRMSLPTAFNVQFDYAIADNFYLNYSGSLPIWLKSDKSKVHSLITNTVSARYETPKYGAGLPVTWQRNGQVNVGLYGRVKIKKATLFIGANNINNLLGQRRIYNGNIYAGIVIGKLYKKPSDMDNDKISDDKDLCPTDSGSYKMKGCPDSDGDKIPDYKDFCPYSYGPKKYNGCPDSDKDGIFDYEDNCPYKKGLRANNGCPDRDKDGIIDTVDRCPDIPGVYENNGCPLNPLVCCLDSDGDGISDAIDSCITVPGPAENNGCPTTTPRKTKAEKVKYEKIKKQKLDEQLENKKVEIESKTVKQVLEDMTTIDFVNIYFGVDKDVVQDQYKEKLRGFVDKINQNANTLILVTAHTDSDGSLEYNMKLSAKRSNATKKHLVKKLGVAENRIVIKNYGEEKSIDTINSIENKSKNRRVEVRMMNIHK